MPDDEATNADAESRVRASFAKQGFMSLIGARIEHFAPGEVDIHISYRPELTQQHGFFHAGATITILDSAAGYAALGLFPPGKGILTTELKVNLLRPATGSKLIARGRVIKPGRMLSICRSDAYGEKDGREIHVATALLTMICLDDVAD